ncbi:alba domain-containing [Trichoderma cornu-damae]|uniref:Alba domain-containing n=1 Tax=Trichoderma cornu-damae TaxID=654480 RepID=A0A9P8QNW1_9HYPO|nr:alba domain-containing [Trichoderma cornu-damae]
MSTANPPPKRKLPSGQPAPAKKPRIQGNATLIGPHEAALGELSARHNVLALSILSSTQIRKRVSSATSHLLDKSLQSPAILLHARPADVCKMITVAEQCKRVLGEHGQAWHQYNELFHLPAEAEKKQKKKKKREEESMPEGADLDEAAGEDSASEDEAFETMQSRFEQAVLPPPRVRAYRSLRIWISPQALPELKSRETVTVQTSQDAT